MSLKSLFSLLVILYVLPCFAFESFNSGARYEGLAGAGVAIYDLWSVAHNQAGLAYEKEMASSLYNERRFMIEQLELSSLMFALPASPGTFGATFSYFGYSLYHENKAGLAFARHIGSKLAVGVMIDYYHSYMMTDCYSYNQITAEGGIIANPLPNLNIGVHILNPFPKKASLTDKNYLPSVFNMGIVWHDNNKFLVSSEIEKEINAKPIFRTGIEFSATDKLFLRTGIMTNPLQYAAGAGYVFKNFTIDFSFVSHQVLGFSPGFSLSYYFR